MVPRRFPPTVAATTTAPSPFSLFPRPGGWGGGLIDNMDDLVACCLRHWPAVVVVGRRSGLKKKKREKKIGGVGPDP